MVVVPSIMYMCWDGKPWNRLIDGGQKHVLAQEKLL